MTVLKLSAVNLDDCPRIPQQALRSGFYDTGFTRSGGSEKQEVRNWTRLRIHATQVHLIGANDCLDGFILADNEPAQTLLQVLSSTTYPGGVQPAVRSCHVVPA